MLSKFFILFTIIVLLLTVLFFALRQQAAPEAGAPIVAPSAADEPQNENGTSVPFAKDVL